MFLSQDVISALLTNNGAWGDSMENETADSLVRLADRQRLKIEELYGIIASLEKTIGDLRLKLEVK